MHESMSISCVDRRPHRRVRISTSTCLMISCHRIELRGRRSIDGLVRLERGRWNGTPRKGSSKDVDDGMFHNRCLSFWYASCWMPSADLSSFSQVSAAFSFAFFKCPGSVTCISSRSWRRTNRRMNGWDAMMLQSSLRGRGISSLSETIPSEELVNRISSRGARAHSSISFVVLSRTRRGPTLRQVGWIR